MRLDIFVGMFIVRVGRRRALNVSHRFCRLGILFRCLVEYFRRSFIRNTEHIQFSVEIYIILLRNYSDFRVNFSIDSGRVLYFSPKNLICSSFRLNLDEIAWTSFFWNFWLSGTLCKGHFQLFPSIRIVSQW